MKNKKRVVILSVIVLVGILICTFSLSYAKIKSINEAKTIGDIAYDVNSSYGYKVYIKENDIYVPYLVLTNNYQNTNMALLLRKNIIGSGEVDNTRKNCWDTDSYIGAKPLSDGVSYDKTKMDFYLNNEFIKLFDYKMNSIICNANIEINYLMEGSHYINRKIFLLSTSELGYLKSFNFSKLRWSYGYVDEGTALKYFDDNSDRRATFEDEKTFAPWWTRTYGWTYNCLVGIEGGLVTETSTDDYFGVRPAFCVPNNTEILKDNSIISGKTVYLLK